MLPTETAMKSPDQRGPGLSQCLVMQCVSAGTCGGSYRDLTELLNHTASRGHPCVQRLILLGHIAARPSIRRVVDRAKSESFADAPHAVIGKRGAPRCCGGTAGLPRGNPLAA